MEEPITAQMGPDGRLTDQSPARIPVIPTKKNPKF